MSWYNLPSDFDKLSNEEMYSYLINNKDQNQYFHLQQLLNKIYKENSDIIDKELENSAIFKEIFKKNEQIIKLIIQRIGEVIP
jgi:hypothetical protein